MSGNDFLRELTRLGTWAKPGKKKSKAAVAPSSLGAIAETKSPLGKASSTSSSAPVMMSSPIGTAVTPDDAKKKEERAAIAKLRSTLRVNHDRPAPSSVRSTEPSPQNSPGIFGSSTSESLFGSSTAVSTPPADRSSLVVGGTPTSIFHQRGSATVLSPSSASMTAMTNASLPIPPPLDMAVLNLPEYHVHISVCLANSLYKATFRSFARKEKSEENVTFLEEVVKYKSLPVMQLGQKARAIAEAHFGANAAAQVNLSDAITKTVMSRMAAADFTYDLFDRAAREITSMLQNDSYSRFKLTSPEYVKMQESHLWAPLRANTSVAPPASRRIQSPLSQQLILAENEMVFWEWDDYGKWLRFPLSINIALICAEHRGCHIIRVPMGDGRLRVDLNQARLFHSPTNSWRPLRRTVVTSDLFCTLASRLHHLLLDRSAAADSLAMLRANLKQRLIDDRSLAPSTGLLENALAAVHRSDPHAILMAATAGSRPTLAMGRPSIAGPSLIGSSASTVMSITDENKIAAQLLRDDMTSTVANVTKLKIICQERISVISGLAPPLKWPPPSAPPSQASTPPTPTGSLSRSSSLSASEMRPPVIVPVAGSSDTPTAATAASPVSLPANAHALVTGTSLATIPEAASVSSTGVPLFVPGSLTRVASGATPLLPSSPSTPTSGLSLQATMSGDGEHKLPFLSSSPSTPTSQLLLSGMAATTPNAASSVLSPMTSPMTLRRPVSSATLTQLIEEKAAHAYDSIAMMAVQAQRAEADFANTIIDDPQQVSASDLHAVYDLITRMNDGPMSTEKHSELDRTWARLIELHSQRQQAVISLEPQWTAGNSTGLVSGGLPMNMAVGYIANMFKATQQFDALIQTFANSLAIAETQLWAVFSPLRAAIRFVNDLIHSRLRQAKEELERDIDKMETICSMYYANLKVLELYLALPTDLPEWLQSVVVAHNQYIDAQRAGLTIEASIASARAANTDVGAGISRLRGVYTTQIARRRAQGRWIKKLSEAARTGWCPDLWRHQHLSWCNFKNSDALAAEGILASLRSLNEYKDMKDMTPAGVTHCQILYARRHDRDICLKRYHLPSDDTRATFLRSVRAWSSLNHVGLMRLRAVFFDGEHGYIESIRPGGGNLREWLSRPGGCPMDAKYLLVRRLCETVGYLHSHQISHHDITLETIGISEAGAPMLMEPNLMAFNDGGASLLTGSERWWLTRMGVGQQFQGLDMKQRQDDTRYREDVHLLGVVIYRCYGSSGGNVLDVSKTFKQLGAWPPLPTAPESANQLLDGMLKLDPGSRLMMATILKLDFFKRPPAMEVDMKLAPPPTCRAWATAMEVIKTMSLPPIYFDARYDKCWCIECIPSAPVPVDLLATTTSVGPSQPPSPLPGGTPQPSPPTSRRGSLSSAPGVSSPPPSHAHHLPTMAMAPAYKVSGNDDQRYTLPYGFVQIGLRVEPRYKNGHQVRVWDEWCSSYYGVRADSMESARATLTSVLTGSLARPVDVDGSVRRAAFRAAASEAAAAGGSAAAAALTLAERAEREPNGVAPMRAIVTTPSIAYASIAAHARRIESVDGRHKVAMVLRCHQHPGFQKCGQTVGGFVDAYIPTEEIEWRTTHDHHAITALLVRVL